MTADYGYFTEGSSAGTDWRDRALPVPDRNQCAMALRPIPARFQLTPSFFCRLDDEVVYWNTSRFSG